MYTYYWHATTAHFDRIWGIWRIYTTNAHFDCPLRRIWDYFKLILRKPNYVEVRCQIFDWSNMKILNVTKWHVTNYKLYMWHRNVHWWLTISNRIDDSITGVVVIIACFPIIIENTQQIQSAQPFIRSRPSSQSGQNRIEPNRTEPNRAEPNQTTGR